MERLLRYYNEHVRVIRLMLMDEDGTLSQVNARILRYDSDRWTSLPPDRPGR